MKKLKKFNHINSFGKTCWIIFIICCIRTGIILINYLRTMLLSTETQTFEFASEMSKIFVQNKISFNILYIALIITSALPMYLFYRVIKLNKFLDPNRPFSSIVIQKVDKIIIYTLLTGFFTLLIDRAIKIYISSYGYQLNKVLEITDNGYMYLGFSAILSVIVLILKKGLALQTENDLTL